MSIWEFQYENVSISIVCWFYNNLFVLCSSAEITLFKENQQLLVN